MLSMEPTVEALLALILRYPQAFHPTQIPCCLRDIHAQAIEDQKVRAA